MSFSSVRITRGSQIKCLYFDQALNCVRERSPGLEVLLTDLDVPIDTSHLERALHRVPMGRKSWLFCWTELGAPHVGIIQSLIVTCRLHGINPYIYLVDVRASRQPRLRTDSAYVEAALRRQSSALRHPRLPRLISNAAWISVTVQVPLLEPKAA